MHNRKYVPGGVALVKGRLKNCLKLMNQDYIEELLIKSDFLGGAPFKWISFIYRYGTKNNTLPEYQKIGKKYGDLPIAVELKMDILEWADRNNLKLLEDILMIGALEALINVGQRYNLPIHDLEVKRSEYKVIPETIEECEQLRVR